MQNKKEYSPVGSLILAAAATIWGFAFTAQKAAADHLEPFSVNSIRFFIGGFFLLLFSEIQTYIRIRRNPSYVPLRFTPTDWIAASVCGGLLFLASTLQQYGIDEGDAGTAAFLTALYIVFVPVLGALLFRRPTGRFVWGGIVLALFGAYLLSVIGGSPAADEVHGLSGLFSLFGSTGFKIGRASVFILLCSVVFSFQILSIDHFSGSVSGVRLAMLEFFVAGTLGLPEMLILERPSFDAVVPALPPLLFLGIFSCGIAYTCQIVGQAKTPPAVAAVIMSLESVFGAVGSIFLLGERMNLAEVLGCLFIFLAVLAVEIPTALSERRKSQPPPSGEEIRDP